MMLVPPSGIVTCTREPVGCTSSMVTGTRAWPGAALFPAMEMYCGRRPRITACPAFRPCAARKIECKSIAELHAGFGERRRNEVHLGAAEEARDEARLRALEQIKRRVPAVR